jgi:hypothetical protein
LCLTWNMSFLSSQTKRILGICKYQDFWRQMYGWRNKVGFLVVPLRSQSSMAIVLGSNRGLEFPVVTSCTNPLVTLWEGSSIWFWAMAKGSIQFSYGEGVWIGRGRLIVSICCSRQRMKRVRSLWRRILQTIRGMEYRVYIPDCRGPMLQICSGDTDCEKNSKSGSRGVRPLCEGK